MKEEIREITLSLPPPTNTQISTPEIQHQSSELDPNIFRLVNSFYGPGTVGSWLLILVSVIVSWTLNPREARKDRLTNDFIAAMMFPCIASAHLAFLLANLPSTLLDVVTAQDLDTRQHASAIAAPYNICELFPLLALLLFTIATWKRHFKRATIVFAVGIWSWVMINVFFFAVHLSSVVEHHSKKSGRGEINIQHGGSLDEDGLILLFSWVAFFLMLIPNALILICSIGTALVLARTKSTAVLDGLATVLGFAVVIYATIAIDVLPARRGSHTGDDIKVPSRPFFFPRTDVSIQDLDQVVALCAGCVTLFFSLYEVFKASRDSVDISEHDTQHEVQQGRNRRRSI